MRLTALMTSRMTMRKYQRKNVKKLRDLVQSNDPLKWVYVSNLLGTNRQMTDREFRIFKRRMFKTFKNIGVTINRAFQGVAKAMTTAVKSFQALADAMRDDPDKFKLDLKKIRPEITDEEIERASKVIMSSRLYQPKVMQPPMTLKIASTVEGLKDAPIIGNVKDLQISVDETEHV